FLPFSLSPFLPFSLSPFHPSPFLIFSFFSSFLIFLGYLCLPRLDLIVKYGALIIFKLLLENDLLLIRRSPESSDISSEDCIICCDVFYSFILSFFHTFFCCFLFHPFILSSF